MDDVLRERVMRHLDALPDDRAYQVLDYIEFLASKYAQRPVREASSLQRFGERLQDRMRLNNVGFGAIRGTLQAMGTADKVVSNITEAGRSLIRDVEQGLTAEQADRKRTGAEERREIGGSDAAGDGYGAVRQRPDIGGGERPPAESGKPLAPPPPAGDAPRLPPDAPPPVRLERDGTGGAAAGSDSDIPVDG